MSEINLSRQITIWTAGLAAVTVFATNMDIITGTATSVQPVAEIKKPHVPRSPRVKKSNSTAIYVPDTLKINRVERTVAPEQAGFNQFNNSNNRVLVPNLFSKKDTQLAKDWTPSAKQKAQFKRFLESQGLKYDPETAFKRPGVNQPSSQLNKSNPKAAKSDPFTAFN